MRVGVEHDDRKGEHIGGIGVGEDVGVVGAVVRGEGAHDAVDLLRLPGQAEGREVRAHRLDEGQVGEGEALRVRRQHGHGELIGLA